MNKAGAKPSFLVLCVFKDTMKRNTAKGCRQWQGKAGRERQTCAGIGRQAGSGRQAGRQWL